MNRSKNRSMKTVFKEYGFGIKENGINVSGHLELGSIYQKVGENIQG